MGWGGEPYCPPGGLSSRPAVEIILIRSLANRFHIQKFSRDPFMVPLHFRMGPVHGEAFLAHNHQRALGPHPGRSVHDL